MSSSKYGLLYIKYTIHKQKNSSSYQIYNVTNLDAPVPTRNTGFYRSFYRFTGFNRFYRFLQVIQVFTGVWHACLKLPDAPFVRWLPSGYPVPCGGRDIQRVLDLTRGQVMGNCIATTRYLIVCG